MVGRQKSKSYKSYKSPLRKSVRFFEQSRNQWKAKCRVAKKLIKQLKKRVRALEESREKWKGRAKERQAEVTRLKKEQEALEKELAVLNQARVEALVLAGQVELLTVVAAHHHYSVGQVLLFVSLVLSAAVSLRAARRVFAVVGAVLPRPLACPSWSAGRLGLLRLGYYKLMRPKEVADDWVWIVDHSIQIGTEKCLVIVGLRLKALPAPERCLGYEDVEPLALFVVNQSNGAVVSQQLEQTLEKIGVPREIIGDKGSDLHAGIQQFCQSHPESDYIYDIKHFMAAVLRQELADDPAWLEFTRLAAQTKSQVQPTALAPLAPPNQRRKARYMNVDTLLDWGQKMLVQIDKQPAQPGAQFDPAQVEKNWAGSRVFGQP